MTRPRWHPQGTRLIGWRLIHCFHFFKVLTVGQSCWVLTRGASRIFGPFTEEWNENYDWPIVFVNHAVSPLTGPLKPNETATWSEFADMDFLSLVSH
jgi:hypothetical protein